MDSDDLTDAPEVVLAADGDVQELRVLLRMGHRVHGRTLRNASHKLGLRGVGDAFVSRLDLGFWRRLRHNLPTDEYYLESVIETWRRGVMTRAFIVYMIHIGDRLQAWLGPRGDLVSAYWEPLLPDVGDFVGPRRATRAFDYSWTWPRVITSITKGDHGAIAYHRRATISEAVRYLFA